MQFIKFVKARYANDFEDCHRCWWPKILDFQQVKEHMGAINTKNDFVKFLSQMNWTLIFI